jgi:hypothetical protein
MRFIAGDDYTGNAELRGKFRRASKFWAVIKMRDHPKRTVFSRLKRIASRLA